jgi:hypothetical protein
MELDVGLDPAVHERQNSLGNVADKVLARLIGGPYAKRDLVALGANSRPVGLGHGAVVAAAVL